MATLTISLINMPEQMLKAFWEDNARELKPSLMGLELKPTENIQLDLTKLAKSEFEEMLSALLGSAVALYGVSSLMEAVQKGQE